MKAKNIEIVNEIPKSYKEHFIGQGCSGRCYLIKENNLVFKELYNDRLPIEEMNYFTYIDNDTFSFPRTMIYKDGKIIGYLCKYIEGTSFDKLSGNEDIYDFLNATDKLEKEIKNLSEEGIELFDIKYNHAIYTKDKEIKLIDTDLYYYKLEEPYYLFRASLKEWGNFLMTYLQSDYPFQNDYLNELYLRLVFDGKVKPTHILDLMLQEMNKKTDYKIQTLGEFKEGQKLIKKLY